MRFNNMRHNSAIRFDNEDQLTLSFIDRQHPPRTRTPITHRQIVEIGRGHHRRAYELVVHQDPETLMVLSYRLHLITRH